MILSDEQRQIQEMARRFSAERLAPNAAAWDRAAALPRAVIDEMGELGFMGMFVPEDWGGAASDHVSFALVLEEIAAGCGAVSTAISGHNSVACLPILDYGTAAQKAAYLPKLARGELLGAFLLTEPQGGSDASNLKTRAVRNGNGWIVNGTKQFITSGQTADLGLVFAATDPDAGKRGISAFVVETDNPGYVVDRVENKLGQRASDTCQISFQEMRLPDDALLGAEGEGYKIALANLEGGRVGIAAQAVGMARAAFEAARDYARERETFGKPIIAHQAVAFRLADMATGIEAARQMTLHAAELRDRGAPCLKEASMAKLFASEMAERVCSDAIQTFGGYGYVEDYPVARIARDVRVCKIYEGTNDIQKLVISRALAG